MRTFFSANQKEKKINYFDIDIQSDLHLNLYFLLAKKIKICIHFILVDKQKIGNLGRIQIINFFKNMSYFSFIYITNIGFEPVYLKCKFGSLQNI